MQGIEPDMNDIQKLQSIGVALWGASWKSQMAEALGIPKAMVSQYLSGIRSIPSATWARLEKIAILRVEEINNVFLMIKGEEGVLGDCG